MKTPSGRTNRRSNLVVLAATTALLLTLLPFASALATAGLSQANATISVDTSTAPGGTGVYTTLTGPIITEGAPGDVTPGGNLVISAPSNWEFEFGSSVTITVAPAEGVCSLTFSSPVTATAGAITTTIGGSATTTGNRCIATFSGIRVRPKTAALPNVGTMTVGYTGSAAINGVASGATVGTLTAIPGAAALSFTQQPSSPALGGEAFTPNQPKVLSKDQFSNPRQNDVISLALLGGTTGASLSCSPSTATTDATGVASFAGCKIDKVGTYTLRASTSGGTNTPTSDPVTVQPGAADHLGFTSYPGATSTTSLGTVKVAIQDKGNNIVTTASASITLAIGTNPSAGVLTCDGTGTGGRTKSTSGGEATFTCSIDKAGNGYTLTADDGAGGLNLITGGAFNVTSGPAAKLAICWGTAATCNTVAPTGFTGGTAWPAASQPQVRVQDANGNTVTSDNTTLVGLSISTNPSNGTLTCTGSLTQTVVSGVAAYADCRIDKAGTGYRLQATSSPALTAATGNPTNAFNVVVGPAAKLGFTAQPGASSSGTAFATQPVVAVQDAGGNTVTTGTGSTAIVTLSIGTNPGGGTLTCTGGLAKAAVAGVATFSGCAIDKAGTGYTLVAAATGLTSATSAAFNVSTPTATLVLTSSQSTTTWRQFISLSAQLSGFAAGTGGNRQVTFQRITALLPGTWVTIGISTTDASGRAIFSYGPPYNTQFRAVFAAATDLSAATSNTITVHVRYKVTLKPGAGTTTIVRAGTRITYTATSRPTAPAGLQRVTFLIYKRVNGIWTFRTSATVPTVNGVASFTWRWSRGEWYMRARGNATIYNTTAYSLLSKVTAR